MQITNPQFLQLISKKQVQNSVNETSSCNIEVQNNAENINTQSIVEEMLAKNSDATIYSIADEVASKQKNGTDLKPSAVIIKKVDYEPVIKTTVPVTKYAISIEDMSASRIANIKKIIYDLHHKGSDPTNPTDPTDPTDPGTGDDDDYVPEEPDEPKPSFIDEFDDVETMFDWMHEQDPTISKTKGLTREQLIQFTQNDKWEDANYDFFGSLGRVFDVLNKNDDEYLTVDEIKELIGNEIGTSVSSFQSKVENYANELQSEFDRLDAQGKLQYAIDMTRDYLQAAGLTEQLKALERLLQGNDTYNSIHIGQISMADLNPGKTEGPGVAWTNGQYASAGFFGEYNGKSYMIYATEDDTIAGQDVGLTLDDKYVSPGADLFDFIDVLVHELTHATAASYSNLDVYANPSNVDQEVIDIMYERGALTKSEYDYYSKNINKLIQEASARGEFDTTDGNFYFSDEKLNRFYYLTYTMWGEYSAYQTDADYLDSIGGDVYDRGYLSMAVDGANEKNTIINHIGSFPSYADEPMPDWKWWTYA